MSPRIAVWRPSLLRLGAFMWSLKADQYDDLDGGARRAIADDGQPVKPGLTQINTNARPW